MALIPRKDLGLAAIKAQYKAAAAAAANTPPPDRDEISTGVISTGTPDKRGGTLH